MIINYLSPEVVSLAFLLIFVVLWITFILRRRKVTDQARKADLRPIPAFERLERAIRLVVEAGQQMHVALGDGGLVGSQAASPLVGLKALGRILRRVGLNDKPVIATSADGAIGALSQDTIRNAGVETGAPAGLADSSGQVGGLTPFSYSASAINLVQEQGGGSTLLAGHFSSEVGLMLEAHEREGSLSIGGSEDLLAQSIMVAGADEPLLGEELFVAGAYLEPDPVHLASLRTQDVLRWLLVGVILIGTLLKLARLW